MVVYSAFMPTIIIEGPPLPVSRKRKLVAALTRVVSKAYDWRSEKLIVLIHENGDENVARGGVLLCDRRKPKH